MTATPHESHRGILLVAGSAIVWSFGGTISRFLEATDSWTVVFWRSIFAALFLLCFMLRRDGPRGTLALFKNMGAAGLGVALCFAAFQFLRDRTGLYHRCQYSAYAGRRAAHCSAHHVDTVP